MLVRFFVLVVLVAMACPGWANGTAVTTVDGSRLNGRISGLANGILRLETEFAGTLEIPLAKVAAIESSEPLAWRFTGGNVLFGTAAGTAGELQVTTPDGVLTSTLDRLVAAWQPDGVDPTLPPPPAPRKWKYEIGVDVGGKSGNTDKTHVGGTAKATLKGPDDKLVLGAAGSRAEENGIINEEEIAASIDYENHFYDGHSWYVRMGVETDQIAELDLRTIVGAGYGYYFIERPDEHELRGRLGLLYRREDYSNSSSEASVGVDLGLHHMLMLGGWGRLVNDLSFNPSIEDIADYRFIHESALDLPLGSSEIWKLRLGVANEYSSQVPSGTEKLDTTYFARILLQFQ